jgi:hypothetical protein
MTHEQLRAELAAGARLVFFEFCISLLVVSVRCVSALHLIRPGRRAWPCGVPYSVVSLLLGWWGVPLGLLWTPLTLWVNCRGGRDVTAEVARLLAAPPAENAREE